MSLNLTTTWIEASRSIQVLPFSKHLSSSSTWLIGAGGLAGDGFAMPHGGVIRRLQLFDGFSVREATATLAFEAGDRIAVYATWNGSNFTVAVTINAVVSSVAVASVVANRDLYATVELLLKEDA